jgi:hypothetical protein
MQCRIISRFKDRKHTAVLAHFVKVMGAGNRVENPALKG